MTTKPEPGAATDPDSHLAMAKAEINRLNLEAAAKAAKAAADEVARLEEGA